MSNVKEIERAELHKTIWRIAIDHTAHRLKLKGDSLRRKIAAQHPAA